MHVSAYVGFYIDWIEPQLVLLIFDIRVIVKHLPELLVLHSPRADIDVRRTIENGLVHLLHF